MVHPRVTNLDYEISRGLLPGHTHILKFGRNTNLDTDIPTDLWDLLTQAIWLAPTQARIHNVASTSTSDDGDPAGVGAQTIEMLGLTSWDSLPVIETVVMDGTSDKATANAYVIIHRMQVLTWGSSGPNVGTITATAVTDGTITAQISPAVGQTQMAILGVPSVQQAYLTGFYASMLRAAATATIDVNLLVNIIPDTQLAGFSTRQTVAIAADGSSHYYHPFSPYMRIDGPAIIKLQMTSGALNQDGFGGFDVILVKNNITST